MFRPSPTSPVSSAERLTDSEKAGLELIVVSSLEKAVNDLL